MYDDAYTRNEDGELAVRTVNVTEGSNSSSYDDVFTRDENGKLALRVTGGGGDTHNKGYFATLAELQEAYPTGEAGDWAIVAESDTVYIWDDTQQAWVDSDQKGQVVSVNSKTGTVVLTAEDVNAVPQYTTMPVASSTNAGDIVQFTGTTDANYTNGYFYKCGVASTTPASATIAQTTGSTLSDLTVNGETFWEELEEYDIPQQTGDYAFTYNGGTGYWDYGDDYFDLSDFGVTYTGTPADGDVLTISVTAPSATYAWTRVDVQPAPSGLPDQTGQSGKFLTTDGTSASWGTKITGSYVAKGTVATINSILRTERNNSTTTTFEMAQYLLGGAVDGQIEFDIRNGNGARVGRIQFADAIWIDAGTNIPTLGKSDHKWYNVYTEKLNNGADIAIPTTGGTMAVIGVNTTATLAVADWSSSTQTVTVSGVKADSVVFVSPDPASASDYASAGILCTAQAADSLTFTCTTTPTNAITVNVVCM